MKIEPTEHTENTEKELEQAVPVPYPLPPGRVEWVVGRHRLPPSSTVEFRCVFSSSPGDGAAS